MRITDIQERSVPISRYADPTIPSGGLTTSMVALTTDVVREGKPVVGYGFASVGRFAQGGHSSTNLPFARGGCPKPRDIFYLRAALRKKY